MLGQTNSAWRVFPPIPARDDCSICQGTGWELMPSNGSTAARRCPCVALTRTSRIKDQIRIPERCRQSTLENFHPGTLAQTRGLAEAWRFVERFPDVERGLVFAGKPGTGKTHLAVGIVLELAHRLQEDTLFVDFHSLPGLHLSLGGLAVAGSSTGTRLRTVSLLVLDDFGAAGANENQYQASLNILHARVRARKPTICTARSLEDGAHSSARHKVHQAHALLLGGFKVMRLNEEDETDGRLPLFAQF